MKTAAALIVLFYSVLGFADVCTVAMTNRYNDIRTYRGVGYGRNNACRGALRDCKRDRISEFRYRNYRVKQEDLILDTVVASKSWL